MSSADPPARAVDETMACVNTIRTFSYGGGVQSTAALVLAAQGRIDFATFLFANVGDDSEHPATVAYVEQIAKPYAAEHGIELVELHRIPQRGPSVRPCPSYVPDAADLAGQPEGVARCGLAGCGRIIGLDEAGNVPAHTQPETLLGRLSREGSRSLPIPVRMSNGAPGTRSCTADFKIRVIGKELKRRGATVASPATVGIGISVDEIQRATPGVDPRAPYQTRTYPLLDLGLTRSDCLNVIHAAGLPQPGKSSCWFCPFHDTETWRRMQRNEPDLFVKACDLETMLNERRAMLGKDDVFLTRHARPLAEAMGDAPAQLPGMDDGACDSGYCFT